MINTLKIKGRMVEFGLTQKDIARELMLATTTVSQKLNNVRPMNLCEARKIAQLLKINHDEFALYFFA